MKTIGNFNKDEFLSEFWQKKPLLIRAGIDNTEQLLTPEELAGLACESDVESRLVTHFDNQWELTHGPIPEEVFLNLPKKNWTVLVQSVDTFVQEVASILDYFTFLPSWRIEDIMVSYAAAGGTVSAHYDFYDVFLVQGKGRRKWQVGEFCTSDTALMPDMPMKILADFQPTNEWILQPGDILYIPPKLAHYGVALEDCMTYSVGFRAPSKSQVFDCFATAAMSEISNDDRYVDTPDTLKAEHFEINQQTIEKIRQSIIELANNDDILLATMAEISSKSNYSAADFQGLVDWRTQLKAGLVMVRSPLCRFNYYSGASTALFADGLTYCASEKLAKFICIFDKIDAANLDSVLVMPGAENLISQLISAGCLIYEDN